jgi:hypothetical protein
VHQAAKAIEQPLSCCPAFAWLTIERVAPTRVRQELRAVKPSNFLVQELIVHGFSFFRFPTRRLERM